MLDSSYDFYKIEARIDQYYYGKLMDFVEESSKRKHTEELDCACDNCEKIRFLESQIGDEDE